MYGIMSVISMFSAGNRGGFFFLRIGGRGILCFCGEYISRFGGLCETNGGCGYLCMLVCCNDFVFKRFDFMKQFLLLYYGCCC